MSKKEDIMESVRKGEGLISNNSQLEKSLFGMMALSDLQDLSHLAGKVDPDKLHKVMELTRELIEMIKKASADPDSVETGGEHELALRNRIRELLGKK